MKKLNLIILFVSLLIVSACSGETSEQNTGDENQVKTVNVETRVVEASAFESHLRVVGMVETSDDIMISAEVGGRIMKYYVDEGEVVEAGHNILKIDDAKLKQEKARLEALTSQARENYERLKKVYDEEGIGSEMDYLNAKYNYQQAKSSLESIKVDIENTSVVAPFDGSLETKLHDVGEMVSPGMQVVRLIGSRQYIVSAGVPARYSDVVKPGDQVKIWFDTQNPDTLEGKINYVAKSINPQNRTFRIEVLLPDGYNYKVDMIANLMLNTLYEDNVIVVSEEFVYRENDDYIMYVKGEDENGNAIAEARSVDLGPSHKSDVIIRNGLNIGDQLITTGSAFLNDGMRLNVIESQEMSLATQ